MDDDRRNVPADMTDNRLRTRTPDFERLNAEVLGDKVDARKQEIRTGDLVTVTPAGVGRLTFAPDYKSEKPAYPYITKQHERTPSQIETEDADIIESQAARIKELESSFELYDKASRALMEAYKRAYPDFPADAWPDATTVNVWAAEQIDGMERAKRFAITPDEAHRFDVADEAAYVIRHADTIPTISHLVQYGRRCYDAGQIGGIAQALQLKPVQLVEFVATLKRLLTRR